MRQTCQRCGKAEKACICQWIQSVDTKTELLVLQHPSEVNRAIGTARILDLSLDNCQLIVGENFTDNERLNQALRRSDIQWFVLYPGESAKPASALLADVAEKPIGFILLDGTWKKAFKIWQLSTNLHALPTCLLDNADEGQYQIRKSSKQQGVSTVEAGYFALKAMEPDNQALDSLLVPFEKMIAFQIAQMPDGVFKKNYL
ncbi:tRNA-uridine aminocarboxypropyltransferase [Thaumasiovibrio subtropicus]|uniref:tRNA-uridine aminocarboxypropyltransferase n=1 Tax=Thaumasiovibrio subtropicus TaxID=1891207 RepID=UPI000B361E3F|nr:tRNA-uridine aminocarboxypropyltransferase [Thaumasiovibrio subtropicus]